MPRSKRWIKAFFLVSALFALCSCMGGGTTGSDSGGAATRGAEIAGLLQNADGSPLPGVEFTLLETGDSTVSDQEGRFMLNVQSGLASLNLELKKENEVQTLPLDNLPQEDILIELLLKSDSQLAGLTVVSISITPLSMPESSSSGSSSSSRPAPAAESTIEGLLISSQGKGLDGARVQFPAFNVETRTNRRGQFTLTIPSIGGRHAIVVIHKRFPYPALLPELPPKPVLVRLKLMIPGPGEATPQSEMEVESFQIVQR